MLIVPTAPAARYIFQRSAADPKCACSGPGSDVGHRVEIHDDGALEAHAGEIVDVALGDVQTVTGEDQRRFDEMLWDRPVR